MRRQIGMGLLYAIITAYLTYSVIHMSKINNKVDEWGESYKAIEEDVSAFIKVSDPKTIRYYVKELNKILDEIHFLGKIVESGEIADDALSQFLTEEQEEMTWYIDHLDMKQADRIDSLRAVDRRVVEWLQHDVDETIDNLDNDRIAAEASRKEILEKINIISNDLNEIKKSLETMNKKKLFHTHKE